MLRVTQSAILHNFDAMTVVRAREYERSNRVLSAHSDSNGWAYGRVKGTEAEPYDVVARLAVSRNEVYVEGECSCPVGFNCKHVAAVLFYLSRRNDLDIPEQASEVRPAPTTPAIEKWLAQVERVAEDRNSYPKAVTQRLLYVMRGHRSAEGMEVSVSLLTSKIQTNGWTKPIAFRLTGSPYQQMPKYFRQVDGEILRTLRTMPGKHAEGDAVFVLQGLAGAAVMGKMLATGRCYWESIDGSPLSAGPVRKAGLQWVMTPSGGQRLEVGGMDSFVLPVAPPWYVDAESGECGPLDSGLEPELTEALLRAPEIMPEQSKRVAEALRHSVPNVFELGFSEMAPPELMAAPAKPCLEVRWAEAKNQLRPTGSPSLIPVARLSFEYAGSRVTGPGGELRVDTPEGPKLILRDADKEQKAKAKLHSMGWIEVGRESSWVVASAVRGEMLLYPVQTALQPDRIDPLLFDFAYGDGPCLVEKGWRVDVEGINGLQRPSEPEIRVDLKKDGPDWFDLELGMLVDGVRIDLRPILLKALEHGETRSPYYHRLPSGQIVALPLERLNGILAGLVDLFGPAEQWGQKLQLPKFRVGELAHLEPGEPAWRMPAEAKRLTEKLNRWEGITPLDPPASFIGSLRDYQKEGLAWLGFLSQMGFGGVLADDMGLGKTVQALAHILHEKELGRMHRPVLIVAPTSTIPNWEQEIAKFAPSLSVLTLQGLKRKQCYAELGDRDIVLTSYALLGRDRAQLTGPEYHAVFLDEAQSIKNASTQVAKAAFELKAGHRIAMSGTPIENNLQELWSLFRFALPGLLGGATEFRRSFRAPIENHADQHARALLSRRIRPFVLRRTKEQVAKELPPKSIIVDYVELDEGQRELYDRIRLAMDQRLRAAIETKGFDRSRMEVLDALLKLRQTCCDPRLVKLPIAAGELGSAKLDRLMEMVEQLVAEGRRALVFSQFTSMLNLIEPRLRAAGIEWVRISGDTDDRRTPVRRFQNGEVPIFLISLKAGGTGLNLTAADTVIHYDPWWNPAVENQATDRAHRIGQDKPVFVYKLVASGTVEEKILQLQERKAALAGQLLEDVPDIATSLTHDDLEWVMKG